MDDRYDDFGNSDSSMCDDLPNDARDEAVNRKVARSAAARKGRLTAALMRTRTEIALLVDRLCHRFFVHAGVKAHFTVLGEQSWDNTLLCWLVEGKLWLQDKDYVRPHDLPITEYSYGECALTVRISRDRGRDLCTFHGSEKFRREIEGAKVIIAYFYEHFKDFDFDQADAYTALKDTEMWLKTPLVERHLRTITERFVPVAGRTHESVSGNPTDEPFALNSSGNGM